MRSALSLSVGDIRSETFGRRSAAAALCVQANYAVGHGGIITWLNAIFFSLFSF